MFMTSSCVVKFHEQKGKVHFQVSRTKFRRWIEEHVYLKDQFWQIGQQQPVFGYRSLDVEVIAVFSFVAHDLQNDDWHIYVTQKER